MMIDIIIPTYNTGSLLCRCIDSLLNQTDKIGYIIYLIDDGSTDLTPDICDKYANKYDNVIAFHKKNGGGVAARRYGLEHSTNPYIVFVDADDFVENDYISNIKRAIANPADYYILNNKRNYITQKGYYIEKDFLIDGYVPIETIYRWFLSSKIGAIWEKIFLRKVINKNKVEFKDNITHGDDFYINANYLQAVNIVYCQNTSSYIHIVDSPTSVCSHDVSIKRLYDIKTLYHSVLPLIPSYIEDKYIEIFKRSIIAAYFVAVGLIIRQKKNKHFLNQFFIDSLPTIDKKLITSKMDKLIYWTLFHKKYIVAELISYIYNTKIYSVYLDKCYEKNDLFIKKKLGI